MKKEVTFKPFLISLTIHAALALWLLMLALNPPKPNTKSTYIIDLEPVQKQVAKKPADQLRKERIVETEIIKKTKEAAPDSFLGKENQVVEKQTSSETYQAREKAKTEQTKIETEVTQVPEVRKFAIGVLPKMQEQLQRQTLAEKERNWAEPGDAARDQVAKDYVKGLNPGAHTLLNTREYVFYSYFERIRKSLDSAWHPILRSHLEKIFRSGRTLASEMDHTTKVLVTLNEKGAIVRVQMIEESGTRDLDEAAIKAFNRAGPFPNPPKGIVDASGQIEIAWDFILRT